MTRTRTACHGILVGAEYLGKHEGIPGDTHFRNGRMKCIDRHTRPDVHTTETEMAYHQYEDDQQPACETCHNTVGSDADPNKQRFVHSDGLYQVSDLYAIS